MEDIEMVLYHPNPKSPANNDAAELFRDSIALYNKINMVLSEESVNAKIE